MKELCLAIVLVVAAVGGLERAAAVAIQWAAAIAQTDDLEELIDQDLDLVPDLDGDVPGGGDSETRAPPPATLDSRPNK